MTARRGEDLLVADVASRFQQLRDRHGWLDHLVRAGTRYTERHGNDYGAAVTYFSVLSLVPVTMVMFAAAGFALGARPAVVERLKNEITEAWPGALGDTLNSVINQAISSAATVGFFGLVAALYSGIGWMTNLRDALSAQWGHLPTRPPIVKRVLFDLLALLGLGLALAVTFAVTGLLSVFAGSVLAFFGLAERAGAEVLLTLLGVLIGLAANWLIFAWVIARLPRERVALRSAAKAAVLGAVGFPPSNNRLAFASNAACPVTTSSGLTAACPAATTRSSSRSTRSIPRHCGCPSWRSGSGGRAAGFPISWHGWSGEGWCAAPLTPVTAAVGRSA
jgi:inner membrane protein YhjD